MNERSEKVGVGSMYVPPSESNSLLAFSSVTEVNVPRTVVCTLSRPPSAYPHLTRFASLLHAHPHPPTPNSLHLPVVMLLLSVVMDC